MSLQELAKPLGDVTAATVAVSTLLKLLPPIAALFAIIWYSVGLYEKITGRPFSESALARLLRRIG